MRILGIDPGLQITGYACVELRPGHPEPALLEAGFFRLAAAAPLPQRLDQLFEDLDSVLQEIQPHCVVIEKLFAHYRHLRTSILMGHARGVVVLAVQRRGIDIDELGATEVKKAVTGHGHASKEQMQRAVMMQCSLLAPPSPPDVADAIAIALCAARRRQAIVRAAPRIAVAPSAG